MNPGDMDNAQLRAYYEKQLEEKDKQLEEKDKQLEEQAEKAERDKEAALKEKDKQLEEQAEKAERDKEAALKEQAQKAENDINEIRYSIFLEERERICKYSSKTCRSNNIYFRLPSQER